MRLFLAVCLILFLAPPSFAATKESRQLLVTFKNENAQYQSAGFQPPYRARKRYAVSAAVRRNARAIAAEYSLTELEQWPLVSLSVYCYVFEVAGEHATAVLAALKKDARVESAQWMNTFETQAVEQPGYNDTYVQMQHGLDTISLAQAHQFSRGAGVRGAVVDSDADHRHEDLSGSISRTRYLDHADYPRDRRHGTAVASIIGANANNALGMVGVAPDAKIEVAEACWLANDRETSICDTFSLAKALDAMFLAPPDIVNLSLCGPEDALLARILRSLIDQGVVVVAAAANVDDNKSAFPASMPGVIAVASIGQRGDRGAQAMVETVYAPGDKILVAVPQDNYEFRSGSSLATAHVSGIAALLKASFPEMPTSEIKATLLRSQAAGDEDVMAVNACRVFELVNASMSCD